MKKKFISLLLALVMILGTAMPVLAATPTPEEGSEEKTEVVIHKIVMDADAMTKHDSNKNYNPRQGITDIKEFFGKEAKTVEGVYFVALSVTENADQIAKADQKDFSFLWNQGETNKTAATVIEPYKSRSGLTNADGKLSITLADGQWKIYEVKELSHASNLKDSKAVPIELSLPYSDNTGVINPLNVYPKNTEEKPKIDKDFENGFGGSNGANPDQPRAGKNEDANAAKVYVGQKVPYEVKTVIPAKTNNKVLRWTDVMSKGLTFNQDVVVTLNGTETLQKDTDYTITQDLSGFVLKFTEKGLAKVNQKNTDQTIVLKYSATVNEDAKVDTTIPNDVRFEYGNNPSEDRQPSPETPETTEVTAKKTWADGTTKEDVIFDLYKKENGSWKLVDTKVLKSGETEVKWTELEKGVYQVRERVNGYVVSWDIAVSTVTATNKKGPGNPPPLNPDEPKVVTGGKKFVKMKEGEDVRLAGAQFVIKNAEGKFLAAKEGTPATTTLAEKQKAYDDAVAKYNEESKKSGANEETLKPYKDKVDQAKAERDAALKEAEKGQFQWVDAQDKALIFESDDQGRFEVKGLAYGTYKAVEIKAPEGYALPTNAEFEFIVEKGSYTSGDVGYNPGESNNAQRIDNKLVNIPQTGGIGTIIFTVAGLAIMGTAVMSLRKKNVERA